MKSYIRLIGDVHGCLQSGGRSYFNLIDEAAYSVQLGDLGFPCKQCPDFHEQLVHIDRQRHVCVLGNHDDYTRRVHHALGDFGTYSFPLKNGAFEFFYIRGAYSLDRVYRLPGLNWWKEEELTWEQGYICVQQFHLNKPRIVLTHDCPTEIVYLMLQFRRDRFLTGFHPSTTNQILQACWDIHRPEIWVFGHHHWNWRLEYKGTIFMCLDGYIGHDHPMGYVDFDDAGHLVFSFPQ